MIMRTTSKPKPKVTKKILVVEDEGHMRLVFDMILNERELQLDYVNNLLDADEYLQQHKPSVIILDNKLPDGFGVDFIKYIRKKHRKIKIIMVSGFASVRDVALENGANAFFEKPFSLDDFNSALDRLLN
jgi:two-component system, OmpR family, response regulator